MWFFVQLCSSWQDFNWLKASRGTSAIAELLVKHWIAQINSIVNRAAKFQSLFHVNSIVTCAINKQLHSLKKVKFAYSLVIFNICLFCLIALNYHLSVNKGYHKLHFASQTRGKIRTFWFVASAVTTDSSRIIILFRCTVCSSIIYTQLDVRRFCSAKSGTFGVLQMLLSQEVDVIFGPLCSSGRLRYLSIMWEKLLTDYLMLYRPKLYGKVK